MPYGTVEVAAEALQKGDVGDVGIDPLDLVMENIPLSIGGEVRVLREPLVIHPAFFRRTRDIHRFLSREQADAACDDRLRTGHRIASSDDVFVLDYIHARFVEKISKCEGAIRELHPFELSDQLRFVAKTIQPEMLRPDQPSFVLDEAIDQLRKAR